MRQTNDRSYLFYRNNTLTSLKCGNHTRAVFRLNELPLAEQHVQGGATRLVASDSQKTVLSALDDEQHNYAFTVFGHDLSQQHGHGILGFSGEHFDRCSGAYFLGNGYRTYSPALMRFHSSDHWSPFGRGGLNGYAYCNNDPVNYQDPSGHTRHSSRALMRNRVVGKFKVEHHETLKTPPVETVGKRESARSQAVEPLHSTRRTTKIFEVVVNHWEDSKKKAYVTKENLNAYLDVTNELNALELAHKMGDPRVAGSSGYQSKLRNARDALTLEGSSLVKRAADPMDMTAFRQDT